MSRLVLVVMLSLALAGCNNAGSKDRPLTYDEVDKSKELLNDKTVWVTGELHIYNKGPTGNFGLFIRGILVEPPPQFKETPEYRELAARPCGFGGGMRDEPYIRFEECAQMKVTVSGRFTYNRNNMITPLRLEATDIVQLSPVQMGPNLK